MTVAADDLARVARDLLEAVGVAREDARRTAQLLVDGDLAGHPSHGLVRLPDYLAAIVAGSVNPLGAPSVVRDDGSTAIVDGDRALGQVAARFATDQAIARARDHGIACVALRRTGHLGRLADWVDRIAAAGLVGLAFANDAGTGQNVAPPGATEARLSTNPLAFGAPRAVAPNLIVDLSTSMAALGKVRIARERGAEAPAEWFRDGLMQMVGGYKGFGLALAVETLAGVLTGAGSVTATSDRLASPTEEPQGFAVIAIDIARFLPLPAFVANLETTLAHVAGVPAHADAGPIVIPGERSAGERARTRAAGIDLPPPTAAAIALWCERYGVRPSLLPPPPP